MRIWKDWNFVLLHVYALYEVWMAYGADVRNEMLYFFAALFFIVTAYGRRIFNAVDSQNTIKEKKKEKV